MKKNESHNLLEALLPVDAAPGFDAVLAQLRQERQARASRRQAASILATTVACLFAVALVTRPGQSGPGPSTNLAATPPPSSLPEIRRLSDAELQDSIAQPSAIVTLPDGRKSLLVLMPVKARLRR